MHIVIENKKIEKVEREVIEGLFSVGPKKKVYDSGYKLVLAPNVTLEVKATTNLSEAKRNSDDFVEVPSSKKVIFKLDYMGSVKSVWVKDDSTVQNMTQRIVDSENDRVHREMKKYQDVVEQFVSETLLFAKGELTDVISKYDEFQLRSQGTTTLLKAIEPFSMETEKKRAVAKYKQPLKGDILIEHLLSGNLVEEITFNRVFSV